MPDTSSLAVSGGRLSRNAMAFYVIAVVVFILVPLPPAIIDVGLVAVLAVAVLTFLTATEVRRAIDFAVLPMLVMVATVIRMALLVAVVRAVIYSGNAGQVTSAFGILASGNSLAIGLVMYLVMALMLIMVLTNGGKRAAEVKARFNLESMSAKQLALDAEVKEGRISESVYKERRNELETSTNLAGSMDATAGFVKQEAILALALTFITLIGGIAFGVMSASMPPMEALEHYGLLAVGVGMFNTLVALMMSASLTLLAIRMDSDNNVGGDIAAAFSKQHRAIRLAGVAVAAVGIIPGMPLIQCVALGGALFVIGQRFKSADSAAGTSDDTTDTSAGDVELVTTWQASATQKFTTPLSIEVSQTLTPLVSSNDFNERLTKTRASTAEKLGWAFPPLKVSAADPSLQPDTYILYVNGAEVGRCLLPNGHLLMMAGGNLDITSSTIPGPLVVDPVFGMPAKWIPAASRTTAIADGFSVITPTQLLVTHIQQTAERNAPELLATTAVLDLLTEMRQLPKTEELVPAIEMATAFDNSSLDAPKLRRVLADLLAAGVPIKDLTTILRITIDLADEPNMADWQRFEVLRDALSRHVVAKEIEVEQNGVRSLTVVTVDNPTEQALFQALEMTEQGPRVRSNGQLIQAFEAQLSHMVANITTQMPAIAVADGLRAPVAALLHHSMSPSLRSATVLCATELAEAAASGVQLQTVGVVGVMEPAGQTQ